MRIIDAYTEILTDIDGLAVLRHIELCGRVCYKSEEKITEGSARRFIQGIISRGHESVLEHYSFTVRFVCDRGVSHEIVRHRIASYSQESTRYCRYGDKDGGCTFIRPKTLAERFELAPDPIDGSIGGLLPDPMPDPTPAPAPAPVPAPIDGPRHPYEVWLSAMEEAERNYLTMLAGGATPQDARAVLPNSLKTEVVMTANLREWRHFFRLRTDKAAHPQIRELTIPLLGTLKKKIPAVFDDIMT
ncbi:MAG: FAD-dependent thymidylate synthase [Oscillospiraceae bacterium]|nr:FAD-dependent thymidylate synthase [Oscillospiraceae bacterium]